MSLQMWLTKEGVTVGAPARSCCWNRSMAVDILLRALLLQSFMQLPKYVWQACVPRTL